MRRNQLNNPSAVKRSIVIMVLAMFLLTPASALAVEIESLKMIEKGTGIAGSDLGWNVTEIGDVNGDSSMDYAVGAPGYGSGDGRVYIFYGPIFQLTMSSASWTINGNSSQGGSFGWSIAPCGDYNGDGKDDFIVGAPTEDRAYLFLGGSSVSSVTQANLTMVGEDDSLFGHSVAGLDYEGNGKIMAAVGSPDHNHLIQSQGINRPTGGVFIYNLSKMFFECREIGNTSNYDFSFMGEADNEMFGFLVENLGDMNGDGRDDLGISDPFYDDEKGAMFIQLGKMAMFEFYPYAYPSQMDGWVFGDAAKGTGQTGGRLGWSFASAGDFNLDMNYDILIGAPFDGEGKVYLFSGTGTGALQVDLTLVSPDAKYNGSKSGDRFGWAIGSTPIYQTVDIVTISASMADNGTVQDTGAIYSFWPLGTSANWQSANDAQAQYFGEAQGDRIGYSISTAEYKTPGNMKILASSPFHGTGGALYLLERNQPPRISQLVCTPPSGSGTTEFTITVNYSDPDGDMPEYVDLRVYHGDPMSSGSPLVHEYSMAFSHGLNPETGLFYRLVTTLNNSVLLRGNNVIDENLYMVVRTKAVRGTMYEVASNALKGPVVDTIPPSVVNNVVLSNDTGVEGTFSASWDWPSEDDFGNILGDKSVSELHVKIRENEAITENNWEDSDTYYTFSGAGELQKPGFRQYDFLFGTQLDTNMFNLQIKPGFASDFDEHVRYFIAFRGVDDKGNVGPISDPVSVEPYWDRPTVPAPIETVTLVDVRDDDGGALNLSWSPSPSVDCSEYRVYILNEPITSIEDNETGLFLEPDYVISEETQEGTFKNAYMEFSSYSGGDLIDGQEYYAAVVAVNWLNMLNPSVTVSDPATVINDNAPAIAKIMNVIGEDVEEDDQNLKISWSPATDPKFKAYHIYGQRYAFGNVDDARLIATITERTVTSLTVTELNDEPLEGGVPYSFAVLVEDHNRHVNRELDENNTARNVYLISLETDPMPQINGVTLRDAPDDNGGSLVVSWYQLYAKDRFLYYNIYMDDEPIDSLTGLTPIKSIWDNLIGEYEFNESTGQKLINGKFYYVAVTIVNYNFIENTIVDSSNTAGPTKPIDQMDTEPPMRPSGLIFDEGSATDNTVTVSWDTVDWNDVPDFNHYLIRWEGNRRTGNEVVADRETGTVTIKGLELGSGYWINVAIVDDAGNVGEPTEDVMAKTTGENQPPYNITIKIGAQIGEFTLWDDNNTLDIKERYLGKEVDFTGTAQDDYTSYIELHWEWVISTPDGKVIVKEGYYVVTEIQTAGEYSISLRVMDEDGLWSENITVFMNVEAEPKEEDTFATILIVLLVVILIVVVIVVFITIKSGKSSKLKDDQKRYDERKQGIEAMEEIYTDLPTWTCPCGTTQIPITETANCPSCYESHEGIPIDGIDEWLQDHNLVLDEMNIKIPLAWQGQDAAIDHAKKDLEERKRNAMEALDEEFAPLLGKDKKPAEEEVSEEEVAPPDGGQTSPAGTPLGATPLQPPKPGTPQGTQPPGTPLAVPRMAQPPQQGTPLQPPGTPLQPKPQQGTPLQPPQGTPLQPKPQQGTPLRSEKDQQ